jgi:hypothetical protein
MTGSNLGGTTIPIEASAGLTTMEAKTRLAKSGPNAMPDTALHPVRRALTKLWAPVPWTLEAAIVLEIFLLAFGNGDGSFGTPAPFFRPIAGIGGHEAIRFRRPRRFSDCPDRDGDIGEFPAGEMVPEFEEKVFMLEPGRRTGVFRSPGFHIAMLISRRSPGAADFETVRGDIERVFSHASTFETDSLWRVAGRLTSI